jgi:hypothetical protein
VFDDGVPLAGDDALLNDEESDDEVLLVTEDALRSGIEPDDEVLLVNEVVSLGAALLDGAFFSIQLMDKDG